MCGACRARPTYDARSWPGATGRTLEIGVGSGLSVPHYGEVGHRGFVLLEPNTALSPGSCGGPVENLRHRSWPWRLVSGNAHELPFDDSTLEQAAGQRRSPSARWRIRPRCSTRSTESFAPEGPAASPMSTCVERGHEHASRTPLRRSRLRWPMGVSPIATSWLQWRRLAFRRPAWSTARCHVLFPRSRRSCTARQSAQSPEARRGVFAEACRPRQGPLRWTNMVAVDQSCATRTSAAGQWPGPRRAATRSRHRWVVVQPCAGRLERRAVPALRAHARP